MTRTTRLFLAAIFLIPIALAAPLRSAEAPKDRGAAAPKEGAQAKREAGDPRRARALLFDRLDSNHDGFLSQLELEADPAARGNWIAMDRNNDGRISRDEFSEPGDQRAAGQGAAAR